MIDHYYNTIVIAIIDITFYAHILKTQDFSIILELPDLLPKIIFFSFLAALVACENSQTRDQI